MAGYQRGQPSVNGQDEFISGGRNPERIDFDENLNDGQL